MMPLAKLQVQRAVVDVQLGAVCCFPKTPVDPPRCAYRLLISVVALGAGFCVDPNQSVK